MTKPKRKKLMPMATRNVDILEEFVEEEIPTSVVTTEVPIPTVEEIVALLEKFPLGFSNTTYWQQKDAWFKEFKPKLEAFLAQCVGRAHLQKLHNDFPMLDEEEAYPNFTKHDLLVYIGKIGEWRERLEAVTGK